MLLVIQLQTFIIPLCIKKFLKTNTYNTNRPKHMFCILWSHAVLFNLCVDTMQFKLPDIPGYSSYPFVITVIYCNFASFLVWPLLPTHLYVLEGYCCTWSHSVTHTTLRRTPLDEVSAHRRDLYLTTHNTHKRETSTPPAWFEPAIPASAADLRLRLCFVLGLYSGSDGRLFLITTWWLTRSSGRKHDSWCRIARTAA
jgi:hypothetical protein